MARCRNAKGEGEEKQEVILFWYSPCYDQRHWKIFKKSFAVKSPLKIGIYKQYLVVEEVPVDHIETRT